LRRKATGFFERSSAYIREAKPSRVMLWVVLMVALLALAGVAVLTWKTDRRGANASSAEKCGCVAATVWMCEPRTSERLHVSRSCTCAEYEDADKLSAQGWVECK
jgi:hypothetical protein